MIAQKFRGLALACGAVVMLSAVPNEGKACCNWFGCGGGSQRTTYAPPYTPTYAYSSPCTSGASPCTTCASPCASCASQTCMYVPQTYYRTYYRSVPVTAYQPVTSCDPCSGCAVTSYYPATAWAYQPCLVPYTTYRVVYSNPCAVGCGGCCGACGACGGCGSCGGCASCGSTVPANPNPAPAATDNGGVTMSRPELAPENTAPGTKYPSTSPSKTGPGDTLSPIPDGSTAPQTFKKGTSWQRPALPSAPAYGNGPALSPSPPDTRTTALPVYRTGYFQLIASPPKTAPVHHDAELEDGGWHAAQD